jgi:hypothetical protein
MKKTCVHYETPERFLMLRAEWIAICSPQGKPNHCAAALLGYFIWKHDEAVGNCGPDQQGPALDADESQTGRETAIAAKQSPFLRASLVELEDYLFGLFTPKTIAKAMEWLYERGFIIWRVGSLNNRRDRARHYQLNPGAVQTAVDEHKSKRLPIRENSPMAKPLHSGKFPNGKAAPIRENSPMKNIEGEKEGEGVKTQPASAGCLAREPLTLVGEPDPSKPPKPKPQTPQTVPGVSAFLAQWRTRFEAVKHAPCMMHFGRDGLAAKRLLAGSGLSAEALLGIAERAWVANGKTFWCKQSVTVAGFAGRFTEIAAELDVKLDKGNVIEDEPEAWAYSQPPAGVMEGVAR